MSRAEGPSDSQASREEIHIWQPLRSHFPRIACALHSRHRCREAPGKELVANFWVLFDTCPSGTRQAHRVLWLRVADGEESHDSAQCVRVRGNLALLTGQVIDEVAHPIIYILSVKAHPIIIHGG